MAALVNDLGTGSPNLTMKLTAWGGSWKDKYDLNYKSQGNVPGGDPGQGNTTWSAWNVFDEKNNYYGTITLHSDGKDSIWMGPDAYKPDGGNRNRLLDFTLEGIGTGIYGLWVQSVFPSFPFAPLAKPAVDPRTQHPIVLRTQGAKIVNDRGADVVLKGLTRPSLEWPIDRLPGYYGEHLSQKDIEFTRGWGANVIRIPLNQTFWKESAPREVIGSYKQIVDAMIYYAIEQKWPSFSTCIGSFATTKAKWPISNRSTSGRTSRRPMPPSEPSCSSCSTSLTTSPRNNGSPATAPTQATNSSTTRSVVPAPITYASLAGSTGPTTCLS